MSNVDRPEAELLKKCRDEELRLHRLYSTLQGAPEDEKLAVERQIQEAEAAIRRLEAQVKTLARQGEI